MLAPQIKAVAWPPLIWAADAPQWKEQFDGQQDRRGLPGLGDGGPRPAGAARRRGHVALHGATTAPLKGAFAA